MQDLSIERIKLLQKCTKLQEYWKPELHDKYCYADACCGLPIYTIREENLNKPRKNAKMEDQYAYDSFQESIYHTKEVFLKTGKWDVLTGICLWIPLEHQHEEILYNNDYDFIVYHHRNKPRVIIFSQKHKCLEEFKAATPEQALDKACESILNENDLREVKP